MACQQQCTFSNSDSVSQPFTLTARNSNSLCRLFHQWKHTRVRFAVSAVIESLTNCITFQNSSFVALLRAKTSSSCIKQAIASHLDSVPLMLPADSMCSKLYKVSTLTQRRCHMSGTPSLFNSTPSTIIVGSCVAMIVPKSMPRNFLASIIMVALARSFVITTAFANAPTWLA